MQADEARELDWQAAAKQVDWMQILLNLMNGQETGRDGQPCFFIGGGHFCGRAKFWAGHDDQHKFVSLLDLLTRTALEARKAALEGAAQHEPKLTASEGSVTGKDGTYTIAFLACTCGWNSDGKASEKETWGAHIRSLAERASKGAGVGQ